MVCGEEPRNIHSAEQVEQFPGAECWFILRLKFLLFFRQNLFFALITTSVMAEPKIINVIIS
jgi:hypothetical protein